jgi:sec-independent protein translocase protein TatA
MFGLGFPELTLIFLILIVLFGATRIPKLGRGLGSGIREFLTGLHGPAGDHSASAPSKVAEKPEIESGG